MRLGSKLPRRLPALFLSALLAWSVAVAADSQSRSLYRAIVKNVDAVEKNLEQGEYDDSFTVKDPSPASPAGGGGGETMTIAIPDAPKMSDEEIRQALDMMRRNGVPEDQLRQMEEIWRTGSVTVQIPPSRRSGGAPSGGTALGDTPAMRGYQAGNPEANSAWAMRLGADMAVASAYGFTTPGMIRTAGEAVKAFPHPLLLNNYAGMIMNLDPKRALFFFRAADAQQPENSLFLTNIASAFLELEDYTGAERYATMALRIDPMFGPAHVIMAVIHLKNGNMELAAESTVKAARNCFDANVEYLFKSLIDATDHCIWKGDSDLVYEPDKKFPLHDEHMKILYEIAKSNVPSNAVNPDIDTPSGQVEIPPFPKVGGPEHLIGMGEYLQREWQKFMDRASRRDQENTRTYRQKDARRRSAAGFDPGVYELDVSLRQKYACEMVRLYYKFQLAQSYERYAATVRDPATAKFGKETGKLGKDWETYDGSYRKQRGEMDAAYSARKQELYDQYTVPAGHLYGRVYLRGFPNGLSTAEEKAILDQVDQLNKAHDAIEKPLTERYREDQCRMAIEYQEKRLEYNRKRETLARNYIGNALGDEERYYLEVKRIMEEYWLKAGGIMKYVSDPLELALLNTGRESFVEMSVNSRLSDLRRLSSEAKRLLEPLEWEYNSILEDKARAEQCLKDVGPARPPKPARTVADAIATAMGGPDMARGGERVQLSSFEEKDDYKLPVFGVEAELFKFTISASADFENMKFTTNVGSAVGSHTTETDLAGGGQTVIETLSGGPLSIFGVQAEFQPLTPKTFTEKLKDLATNKAALGFVASKLTGPVSLSYEEGTYQTIDPSGRITDRGRVKITGRGIGVDPIGVGETTVINTSATGVTSKTTTRKYKFIFMTIEK